MYDPKVVMEPVKDEFIDSLGYIESKRHLYIKFTDGGTILYSGVPRFRFSGLQAAPLKKKYFESYIKAVYLSKKVD